MTDHISDARQMVVDQLSGNPGELLSNLRKVESSNPDGHPGALTTNWHRNPEGPEAADLIERLRAERDEAMAVLTDIAKGETPPERNGHYLAHRQAVKAARTLLQSIARETGK